MFFLWKRSGTLLSAVLALAGCGSRTPEIRTFSLGERAQVGPLIYNAFDTQWLVSLGEGPSARVPQNRFLLVKMTVVNGGTADASIPSVSLVDDSGQTYSELSSGDGIPNWMGVLRKLHPAETGQGNIAFDVPPKHYKLRVADEADQYALVDIPLRFDNLDSNRLPPPPPAGDPAPTTTPVLKH
jgi:hypothetical protein